MDTYSTHDAPARQPLFVRCGPTPQAAAQTPVVKDWKAVNRDISSLRPPAPRTARPAEDEDPERWDGMA